MPVGEKYKGTAPSRPSSDAFKTSQRVIVALNDELIAATEGWRLAHGIQDQSEAFGELIRLGLLGEISKIFRLVSDKRPVKG